MEIHIEVKRLKNNDYDSFFSFLKNSKKTVVLTGAGISTLSGIKDFRSSNGLYSQEFGHMRVEDILDIDFFISHPSVFYSWAKDAWYNMHDFTPNIVHKVLKTMEDKGLLAEGIYTQNIDGLHTREGSKKVYELHGTIERSICTKCGESFTFDWTKNLVDNDVIPMCPHCGGLVKPDIVFYGENLDSELLYKADAAFHSPDLCIVLGSSLVVQPAASLPYRALRTGSKVCIVNRDQTYIDEYSTWRFDDLEEWGQKMNDFLRNL